MGHSVPLGLLSDTSMSVSHVLSLNTAAADVGIVWWQLSLWNDYQAPVVHSSTSTANVVHGAKHL